LINRKQIKNNLKIFTKMKQHQNKKEDTEVEKKSAQNQEEKTHIENSKDKISELSEEEQEELRAEARERYNRLLGCGG
jgi:hypothetical protein